jgi:glycosyltransferase involved in cell wall biosynthesis
LTPLVGIDASRYAGEVRTGTETYSRELIDALGGIAPLPFRIRSYVNRIGSDERAQLLDLGDVRAIPFPRFWTHCRLSLEMALHRPDLLFVPSHVIPVVHPASVVTVHDLGYLHEPDAHPVSQRRMLDLTTRWNARASRHMIAISETTKRDLIERYNVPDSKITVVHHGVSQQFSPQAIEEQRRVRSSYGLPEQFVLAVGTVQPRKNLARLAQAVAALRDEFPELQLVIAGKRGWLADQVEQQIADTLPDRASRYLGYVALEDLPGLYSATTLTALVSTYEGFGLPVLEAMRSGSPVVISDTPALVEVAGSAALVAPADQPNQIASAIRDLLLDPDLRRDMSRRGLEHAAALSWDRTARQTVAVLESVLQRP